MSIRRAALAVVSVLAAVGIALASAAPASAAPSDLKVVVFSNALVSDVGEEVALEIAGITPIGATITEFDGGDGSSAAWAAALNGSDVLILPEMENDEEVPFFEPGGGLLSPLGAQTIASWVHAGGWLFFHGSYEGYPVDYGYLVSLITGKDYDAVFVTEEQPGPWLLQGPITGAPAQLDYVDGTYGLDYGSWPADLQDGVQPVYLDGGGNMVVGAWEAGEGALILIGYDWYPDEGAESLIAEWEAALVALISLQEPGGYPAQVFAAPAPELAATGSSAGDAALTGLAVASVLMLLGAAAVVLRRRAGA